MLETVFKRALRAVFGGGGTVDLDIPTAFNNLMAALVAATEAAIDTGTATGGSNITIVDTGKSWAVDMWVDATYEVEIGATHYLGIAISNTLTTITFAVLPGGATVIAGCKYALKRPVDIADISDRAARLLGITNPRSEAGAGQAPVGVNVTVATTPILAANANRKAAVITNDSDTTIYLAIGVAAVANQGIRLNANGGVLVLSRTGDIFSTEAVNGIHAGVGNKVATAQELN